MKIKLFIFILLIFSWSCGPSSEEKSNEMARMDSLAVDNQVTEAATSYSDETPASEEKSKKEDISINVTKTAINKPVTLNQSLEKLSDTLYLRNVRLSKKFIKTAELQFKVKNVEKTAHKIESLALKLDGYVQQSQISNNIVSTRDIDVSPDTVMKATEFYMSSDLVIRVPSLYFDSVLNELSKLHIYLNRRNVKTEDVSTIFLRNKLKGEKRTEYEKRIQKASDQGNRRLDDVVEAERTASDLADIAIDKKIENYELQDRIDFSTITINIYQANTISKEWVENTTLTEYQPSFWLKAWNAIKMGWNIILNIIIGLLYLWPLYILAFAIYFAVKAIRNRLKK